MKLTPAIQKDFQTVGTPTNLSATSMVPPSAAKSEAQKSLKVVIEKLQAINDTFHQFDVIVNKTNATLNTISDKALGGFEKAVDALNILKKAPKGVGQFGNFADRVVVLITEMQAKVTSMREQMEGIVGAHITKFLTLRDNVDSALALALEKVAILDGTEVQSLLLQAGAAVWPFDWIFGGSKKNVFDQAEDAITTANKTVARIADFLGEVNVSSIGLITDSVFDTLQSVTAQFEEQCTVFARETELTGVLATQATKLCRAPNATVSQLSPIITDYEQFIIKHIVIAQDNMQTLSDGISMLMKMVEASREEEEEEHKQ